jgi:hypothetical protein
MSLHTSYKKKFVPERVEAPESFKTRILCDMRPAFNQEEARIMNTARIFEEPDDKHYVCDDNSSVQDAKNTGQSAKAEAAAADTPTGVHWTHRKDRGSEPYWYCVASWWDYERETQYQRWYSVNKYGVEGALKRAIAKREQMLTTWDSSAATGE